MIMLVSCAHSQETIALHELHDKGFTFKNRKLYYGNEAYTGLLIELSEKKDTLLKAMYRDGLPDGLYEEWYDAQHKSLIRYYDKGEKTGKHFAWWPDGKKKFEIEYQHDMFSGMIKEWNEAGLLYHSGNYLDGNEDGLQQFWRPNGKLYANYVVKNGRQYGLTGTKNCVNVSDSL